MDTEKYKKLLTEEKETLVAELQTVGRVNPDNPLDWEPVPPKNDGEFADANDRGDNMEGFEENSAILKQLEIRLNNVQDALKRIEDGTYGICEISKEEIEEDRLSANPAARTCKKHINEEPPLS
ncbi:MAG: TraR/DksA C4-type zinc finger protein [Candidatus Paceibacterota bacterium]